MQYLVTLIVEVAVEVLDRLIEVQVPVAEAAQVATPAAVAPVEVAVVVVVVAEVVIKLFLINLLYHYFRFCIFFFFSKELPHLFPKFLPQLCNQLCDLKLF